MLSTSHQASGTFNETAAKLGVSKYHFTYSIMRAQFSRFDADINESTVIPVPTSSSSKASVSPVPVTSTSASTPSSPVGNAAVPKSDVNAVAGGLTGAIIGLGLVVAFFTWYFYRRSKVQPPADLEQPKPADMRQYIANTKAAQQA